MKWSVFLTLGLLPIWWLGCTIEESAEIQTGSIDVHLLDSTETEISEANIYIDNIETGQRTPAVISNIAIGTRQLRVWKSGYLPVDTLVQVLQFDTTRVSLITVHASMGAIELVSAPDSVVLLLNGEASGQTPPTIFPAIGMGSYRLSAYLPDFATDLPALWRVQVVGAETLHISVHFTLGIPGNQPDNLVIPFTLLSDWDRDFAIQNWRGHVVLVNFWFIDCPNCILEFPCLQQVYEELGGDGGFQLLAVNSWDAMGAIHEFRAESNLTFPFLSDGDRVVNQDYGVAVYPTNFLVDKRGVIRHRLGRVTYDELRAMVDELLAE